MGDAQKINKPEQDNFNLLPSAMHFIRLGKIEEAIASLTTVAGDPNSSRFDLGIVARQADHPGLRKDDAISILSALVNNPAARPYQKADFARKLAKLGAASEASFAYRSVASDPSAAPEDKIAAAKPESTEGMGRCWSGWGSEGMGMAGTALIPTDRGWFVV